MLIHFNKKVTLFFFSVWKKKTLCVRMSWYDRNSFQQTSHHLKLPREKKKSMRCLWGIFSKKKLMFCFATQNVVLRPAVGGYWIAKSQVSPPDPLNQNLHFSKILTRTMCMLKFESTGVLNITVLASPAIMAPSFVRSTLTLLSWDVLSSLACGKN